MSSAFTRSYELPISFRSYIPKPSYDPTNNNCIIISTYYDNMFYYTNTNQTSGIYKYDMVSNKSQIIHEYNDTFKPCYHSQFIDTSNNTLILYG
eukprot:358646_1